MSLLFCIVSVYAIAIYCKCVCANKILSIFYSLKIVYTGMQLKDTCCMNIYQHV